MKKECTNVNRSSLMTELLILKDGRILVHNLTPTLANLLSDLNPTDEQIGSRAIRSCERERVAAGVPLAHARSYEVPHGQSQPK